MEDILRGVSTVVGVSGCFVCDEEGEILATALSNMARDYSLSVAAYTAAQTLAGLRVAKRRKAGDIDLLYRGGRVLIKPLTGGCLCLVCEPRVNMPLLKLTLEVAVGRLQSVLKVKKQRPAAPAVQPAAPAEQAKPQETPAARSSLNSFLRPFGR